jgi:glycosyltransferase involved in cell wall biosynthesis
MNANQRSIGLYAENDGSWIAGVLYLQTVATAFAQVPESERPHLQMIMPRKLDPSLYRWFQAEFGSTHSYGCGHGSLTKSAYKLFRQTDRIERNESASLKAAILKSGIELLFPCQRSLGTDFPIPWVGWIPDFQHRRVPQFFQAAERDARDARFQRLIDDAAHIVVSSEDAYDDLFRWYQTSPERVSIYRFCTSIDPAWLESDPCITAKQFDLPDKYLMFPSQSWKHKNHLTLFRAIAELKRSGINDISLVLTGKDYDYRHPDHADSLKRFILDNDLGANIRHLGLIERKDQIQLMRRAVAIVQPSYFEGWSMLVEDCRALGKRVYLSDIPVHREQIPPHATFCAPVQWSQITQAIGGDWRSLSPGPDRISEVLASRLDRDIAKANASVLTTIFERALYAMADG